MKLKMNKASDLSFISVLPPHARRPSVVPSAAESSVLGKSQASQVRSQQQSQQSFSQGFSSQQVIYSQLSQSSLDDFVPNEQINAVRPDCHGQKHETAPVDRPKGNNDCSPPREVKFLKKDHKTTMPPKIEMGSWTTVKNNQTCMKQKIPIRSYKQNEAFQQKIPIRSHKQNEAFQQERECRVTIESDEDIDAGFSCLLEENGTGNLHFLPASFIFEDFTISKVISTSCN